MQKANSMFNPSKFLSKQNFWFVLLLCLSLGLAPFSPEPHVWGEIKWLMGGGVGMQPMDYFDLLFHGFPWFFLLVLIGIKIGAKKARKMEP
jgi:hypothetical protein